LLRRGLEKSIAELDNPAALQEVCVINDESVTK